MTNNSDQAAMHDELRAIATRHADYSTDTRGRESWEFDEHGLAQFAAALSMPASEAVLPDGGPPCKQHPGAPHGFSRNASHSEDRYVCDCEGWSPEPAADLLVRDVCELDPADPESPDTVTVHVAMLQLIANRYCTPQPAPAAHAGGEAGGRILTCVYCGNEYPQDTPAAGDKVLTDHIRVCASHPLRAAEATIERLRSALIGLVGVSDPDELRQMEAAMRSLPAPDEDKAVTINAIHALLSGGAAREG